MSDATIFVLVFGGMFLLRVVVATVLFFFILPAGDRCINCDAPTLRVQAARWHRLFPWFRPSWCYECGWHGMLRTGPLTPDGPAAAPGPRPSGDPRGRERGPGSPSRASERSRAPSPPGGRPRADGDSPPPARP